MAQHKTEAFLLRQVDYGETTKIFTLLSRDAGKLSVIAKGVKRPKSKMGGALEPILRGEFSYYRREGANMGTLSRGEVLDGYEYLRSDLARLSLASLFAECVILSGEADSHSGEVYDCLAHFLSTLERAANPVAHTAQYLLKFLALLGFRPELRICTVCGRKAESFPGVRSSRGGVVCGRCVSREPVTFPLDKGLLNALRASQQMDYERLATLKMSAAQANQALRLMVQLLREHLESDLKSYGFLESMVLRPAKSESARKKEK